MTYPNPEQFTSSEQLKGFLMIFQINGEPVPQSLQERLNCLLEQEALASNTVNRPTYQTLSETPIYDELVRVTETQYGPMPEEKVKCIKDTVAHLMEEGEGAEQPGLLLGKIQSGKTDTFVKIMGLCFDKGFDTCIVLTKGTNALADQTVSRMIDDFEAFSENNPREDVPQVAIYDIMQIKGGLTQTEIRSQKNIIVCKKEDDNIKHLISLFTDKSPLLKEKKTLIIDDEADFASWNYMKRGGEIQLAVITKLINQFIHIPYFCRYLQVTATPYSLYLQPDKTIVTEADGCIRPMKPRFTSIVPVHAKYVGGNEYFVKPIEEPESVYSYIFHPISDKCLSVLKKKNLIYKRNLLTSMNIYDFRYAILSYIVGTVIRKIQQKDAATLKERNYRSSCLIHLQVSTAKHIWQEELVKALVDEIIKAYTSGDTIAFVDLFDSIYEDFESSISAANRDGKTTKAMPSKQEVLETMRNELSEVTTNDIVVVVNSKKGISELLDKKNGQLKLRNLFNIFIGGSILDRGITINNMISFFYGRETKQYQQDTVLQHMRQYGTRSNEDVAVTRLHTTNNLYQIMVAMHHLDEQLRSWLTNGEDPECKAVFVGIAEDMSIAPCARNKIIVSKTMTMTPSFRSTVYGFQTGTKTSISRKISAIDNILQSLPNYIEGEFFDAPKSVIADILRRIRETYEYDQEYDHSRWNNMGLDWNERSMIGCLDYINEETVHCLVKTGMRASRVRQNGKFVDAPDTGSTDLRQAREIAQDKFAVMLFREDGLEEDGWRGTPFYWPVLVGPANLKSAVFTFGSHIPELTEIDCDLSDVLEGIDPEEYVKLNVSAEKIQPIIDKQITKDLRSIGDHNANAFVLKDIVGHFVYADGVQPNEELDVQDRNNGIFPFKIRPLKYLLLCAKGLACYEFLLVKIDQEYPYELSYDELEEDDVLCRPGEEDEDVTYDNQAAWFIEHNIRPFRFQRFLINGKTPRIEYHD